MPIAIKAENLSKAYQLGVIGTGTLSNDLKRWYARTIGKEDPFLKIGETNDRTAKGDSDVVWSLKDINFEIEQGDAVGIIGRNGAGKSTLLKILSRVTAPTTGKITGNGRVASLLEVGTGFHPELTGKENIFLNGAILGMRKKEIARKFDEIVDFAGVERYIDTPVKRYSSGMYVRLAFAVAAHLESEILIVDEVLAVGDAEFQKKCLGKMGEVSKGEGRTVLFVSHNMAAVKTLCKTGIIMNNGYAKHFNRINDALEAYQQSGTTNKNIEANIYPKKSAHFKSWHLIKNNQIKHDCYSREVAHFKFELTVNNFLDKAEFGFILRNNVGDIILSCNSRDFNQSFKQFLPGDYIVSLLIRLPLRNDNYIVDVAIANEGQIIDHWVAPKLLRILSTYDEVLDEKWKGIISEQFEIAYEKVF